jgi:hypothetical protein
VTKKAVHQTKISPHLHLTSNNTNNNMGNSHHPTPKKSEVLGTISFLEKEKIPHFKSRVFKHFGVSYTQGWEIIRR